MVAFAAMVINSEKKLQLGKHQVWPPVLLAPMAGITDYPFRKLCQSFGAPLTISEMVTARPLVENNIKTKKIAEFGPDEHFKSIQLYGVDPYYMGEATKLLVNEQQIDHIDLNFGCPVKKITRKGGGAVLPYKHKLLASIIKTVVTNAGNIPVTIKFRLGINDEILTYLRTGKIAQEEGCAAVGLHARTAAQFYSGDARWSYIKHLKEALSIPVFGNGDIWQVQDALKMMQETGCDGVIIGRGCLGNPWLFQALAAAFNQEPIKQMPSFATVREVMLNHASIMCSWYGELKAMINFRKHASWYTKGFRASTTLRELLMTVTSFNQLTTVLSDIDDEPYPIHILGQPRGKSGRAQVVQLPENYLTNAESLQIPADGADSLVSGG